MNKNNIWFITTKTNLHVGNENASSYGIIDLAVQRHATTNLPCINSSSLKGALNEFATRHIEQADDLIKIFGSDKKGRNKETKKGCYTFFDAEILFLPKQSETTMYELVTCDAVLQRFFNQVKLITGHDMTEDDLKKFKYKKLEKDSDFIDLCSNDNLPIIARNVLDNGESKNLWYEQVVPAETVFYTIIDDDKDRDKNLSKILTQQNAIVQIGANATIGYGYCKFANIK